jgi:hypothetical protein
VHEVRFEPGIEKKGSKLVVKAEMLQEPQQEKVKTRQN